MNRQTLKKRTKKTYKHTQKRTKMDIQTQITALLKQAETLQQTMMQQLSEAEKDLHKIDDENLRNFLKKSLYLAKENKITAQEFINQYTKHTQSHAN